MTVSVVGTECAAESGSIYISIDFITQASRGGNRNREGQDPGPAL